MTSKTSFFNFGIYKMTLRRFFWGAVAYFVLLFLTCVFPILLEVEYIIDRPWTYTDGVLNYYGAGAIPLQFISIVPVVVALLIFRCIHEKRQNIFIGSLPVKRVPYFVSSVLAGFTLMAVPVLLNGAILMVTSYFIPAPAMTIWHCLSWLGVNLFSLFFMFSYAVFAATLTGNSFMAVFLNGFLHVLPCIIVALCDSIGYYLVNGYGGTVDVFAYIPGIEVFLGVIDEEEFGVLMYLLYGLLALALYVGAAVIYKIRKAERTGDVVIFRFLNPVLKYFLTFCAAWLMFVIWYENGVDSNVIYLLTSILVTAFVYFGCEMILKKSVRVFRASYKGLLLFIGITVASLWIIGATGFFGYSSYVPEIDEIQSVTILNEGRMYWYESDNAYEYDGLSYPASEQEEAILFVADSHRSMMAGQPKMPFMNQYLRRNLYLRYTLKNGKVVERYYEDPSVENKAYVDKSTINYEEVLYQYDDYKWSYNQVLRIDPNKIESLAIEENKEDYFQNIYNNQDILEFMKVLQEEVAGLSYEQCETSANAVIRFYGGDGQVRDWVYSPWTYIPKTRAWLEAYTY